MAISRLNLLRSMSKKRGLVLGVYTKKENEKIELKLTETASKYNAETGGKLLEQINIGGPIKMGQSRIFWNVGEFPAVAVTGLGDESDYDNQDLFDYKNERNRIATAAGVKALISNNITDIEIEKFDGVHHFASAEGAILCSYKYKGFKSGKKEETEEIKFNLRVNENSKNDLAEPISFMNGVIAAEAQNWARELMETPANLMTPTIFANTVKEKFNTLNDTKIIVEAHDRKWAEKKGMGSFLSVSNGSREPPVFLEITYNGSGKSNSKPICLVGKGITFDSGGISLKPAAKMDEMRADMGGAAVVVATAYAWLRMKPKANFKILIPLCENMPGGHATKPGDVVTAMNGKTICVDNTDAEGRLVLADALCYASEFNPRCIVDVATLTGAIRVALGDCVTGCFTNDEKLWKSIDEAGNVSGDRVWRMPLFKHYTSQVCEHDGYDINNLGKGKGAGSCVAAAFLRQFVPKDTPWMHLDIAGVMSSCSDQSYIGSKGMTGRPVRTLLNFVRNEENHC